jgi:BlaI family penicillinase repressor
MEKMLLSEGEWKIMNILWKDGPSSLMELVRKLESETSWSKSTVFVMMKRLVSKEAVKVDTEGKLQRYEPLIERTDAEARETGSFLSKVYHGSVRMMMSSLAEQKSLSKEDIAELRHILDVAEDKLESK